MSREKGTVEVRYRCSICKQDYDTPEQARACAEQPFATCGFEVGQIVVVPTKWYGWYEDERWIALTVPPIKTKERNENTSHFDLMPHHHAYWVVVNVRGDVGDSHRPVIDVATMAFSDHKNDIASAKIGWTPCNGVHHHLAYRATPEGMEKIHERTRWPKNASLNPITSRVRRQMEELAIRGTAANLVGLL